jgi:glycerol-3-phosphate acyltransferase PlsY
VDVRSQGSGNIGATNVTRVAGKKLGAGVLLLDALKGFIPVLVTQRLLPGAEGLHVAVALATVTGHVFPVWLRFRGGKGVATALGVLVALEPIAAGLGLLVYAAVFAVFRVSAAGSLLGALTAMGTAFMTGRPRPYAWMTAALFVFLVWTHRSNLTRIWRRGEKSF